MTVQSTYNINPDVGYAGDVAQASGPHSFDSGVAQVPANGRKPRPGDAVYYDRSNDGFAVPTNAATIAQTCGILTYRKDVVQNRDHIVEFDDGEQIEIGVFGGFWVNVGSAVEYGDRLVWNTTNNNWERNTTDTLATAGSPADVGALKTSIDGILTAVGRNPVYCVSSKAVASGGIAIARFGFGRVF